MIEVVRKGAWTTLAAACAAVAGCCESEDYVEHFELVDGRLALTCVEVGSPGKAFAVKDADVTTKLAKFKEANGVKTRFFSVQAKKKKSDAGLDVGIPYALSGDFFVEITAGVFSSKSAQKLGDGYFGIELRDPSNPALFYGVHAKRRLAPDGLEISVTTHDGPQGTPLVIDGRDRIRLSLSADAGTLHLTASPGDTVASVQLVNPAAPHVAWLVVRGIADRSSVGFTNLGVSQNESLSGKGPRAAPNTAAGALDHFEESMRATLEGFKLLNVAVINPSAVSMALNEFDTARARIGSAIRDVQGFAPGDADLLAGLRELEEPLNVIFGYSAFGNTMSPAQKAAGALKLIEHAAKSPVVARVYRAIVGHLNP